MVDYLQCDDCHLLFKEWCDIKQVKLEIEKRLLILNLCKKCIKKRNKGMKYRNKLKKRKHKIEDILH